MLSINGGITLLTAQRILGATSRSIFQSIEKLSTGQRINRGSDDPAGLVASENLRAVLSSLESQVRSLLRADHVANVADGALAGTSDLLIEANGLAVTAANSAGLSDAEKQAIQGQIDSILATVDRTAGSTTFNGDPLLDGTATLRAGGATVDLLDAHSSSLGATDIDGTTYTLADLRSGGALNLVDGDISAAQQVIRNSITEVASNRGRIGAFQRHTIAGSLGGIQAGIENLAAANSVIRDTNFAVQTAILNRSLVLHEAAIKAIGIMVPIQRSVLDLLG